MTLRRVGYAALNQHNGLPRPWWEHVPRPVSAAAVKLWSFLPRAARAPFVPLGRWINPPQRMSDLSVDSDVESVPGVAELCAQGFEPIETYTGAVWVGPLWPKEHSRSVAETRSVWLDDPHTDGRLWLVRSPWPTLTLEDSLNLLWTWVERDHAALDDDLWHQRVSEALGWNAATATDWHRRNLR